MNPFLNRIRAWFSSPIREERMLDTRPALARALYVLALVLAVGYGSVHVYRYASIVTDENVYVSGAKGVTITSIVPGGASDKAGLKVGDVIVEINGNPVKNAEEAMVYIVEGTRGKVLDYLVDRDGKRHLLHISLAYFGVPVTMVFVLIVAVFVYVLGSFVFLRRPGNKLARLYGWAHLFIGLFLTVLYTYGMWYYRDLLTALRMYVTYVSWVMGTSLVFHLLFNFPVQRFTRPVTRGMIAVVYALPALIPFILELLLPQKRSTGMNIGVAMCMNVVVEVVLRTGFHARRSPEFRARARLVYLAGISVVVFFVAISITANESIAQPLVFISLTAPMLLFATVVRQRLFDLYIVVRKNSLYFVSVVALNLLSVLLVIVVINVLANVVWTVPVLHITPSTLELVRLDALPYEQQIVVEKGLVLMVGLAFTGLVVWLRRVLRRRIDTAFHRGSYDYRRALQDFSHLSTRYSDKESLADEVVRDISAIMHLKGAGIAFRTNGHFTLLAVDGLRPDPAIERALSAHEPWVQALTARGGADAAANLEFDEDARGAGVEFLAPVLVDTSVEAVLLLGGKLAETNYTKDDVELLNNLTINIADALVIMDFYEGAKEKERIRRELEIARRIQLGSLPTEIPSFPGVDVAASSIPALEVGGDFYDFLTRHDAITCLIGDVSGKGTPAALYLARIQGVIRTIDSYHPTPWELLVRLNTQLFDNTERQMYVTLGAVRIELAARRCVFLRAGHLPLVHYTAANGDITLHQPQGIGAGLDIARFGEMLEEEVILPQTGDVFVLPTDGIVEAFNTDGEEFGIERLSAVVRANASATAEGIKDSIIDAVNAHADGAVHHDDMTVVVVRFS